LFFYLRYKATHITTDDAFVESHIHTVASKVPGTVKSVLVRDNQFVKKGDLLVEIDPVDYDVRMKEADAALHAEKARLGEIGARVEAAQSQMTELKAAAESARANHQLQEALLAQAERDIRRAENLFAREAISKERHEKALTDYQVAYARLKASAEQLKQAEKAMETQKAVIRQNESLLPPQQSSVKQREASMTAARLNIGYTRIYAPSDGHVTRKSVEEGNQIQAGQPLMAVVPLDQVWVIANYKETQIEKVKPGQKVQIRVDTYGGKEFSGKVDSIMAGTGAVFSLFPPENATGNYVKVVQRIPLKIVLDKDTDRDHVLRVGMSVVPTILIE
ncbi:MAG TPA: HlyD family secretion protein, partial [Dissulfurispiraceae bacterium]|nr:HlyD family secretion protein [Dissulfurispiraceae bacterium]